jgi:outer membrane lipoprotein SlyB
MEVVMRKSKERRERSSVRPPISQRAAGAIAGVSGSLVGATLGAIAGPPGMVAGGILGAAAGAAAGATIEREHERHALKDEALDKDIGVIGGDLGRS